MRRDHDFDSKHYNYYHNKTWTCAIKTSNCFKCGYLGSNWNNFISKYRDTLLVLVLLYFIFAFKQKHVCTWLRLILYSVVRMTFFWFARSFQGARNCSSLEAFGTASDSSIRIEMNWTQTWRSHTQRKTCISAISKLIHFVLFCNLFMSSRMVFFCLLYS